MKYSYFILTLLLNNCLACLNVRNFEDGQMCVCNLTYCDSVPKITIKTMNDYQLFKTSKTRTGFNVEYGQFVENNIGNKLNIIEIMPKHVANNNRKIIGFGGSFTDSTGINIKKLPKRMQDMLLESYFGIDGIGYTFCRVPIGGTDFSTRPYSYCDKPDENLTNFELQPEDFNYKIPVLLDVKKMMLNKELKLFASAWTAPPWMKTNNNWIGVGTLKSNYYQLWTDYYIRFLDEYHKFNISIWGITTGNEPMLGFLPVTKINAMAFSTSQIANWIANYLGPTLKHSKYPNMKIMIQDETRLSIHSLAVILDNEKALEYVDGVAFHWYFNKVIPVEQLKYAQTSKKDLFIISSEACIKKDPVNPYSFLLGSWTNAEDYIDDIMENLGWGTSGWIDWNMALDMLGGPTYINNFVQASILVDEEKKEFYKQPTFYAFGHFSKFILPDSIKINLLSSYNNNNDNIKMLAFKRPDRMIALILYNKGESDVELNVMIYKRFAKISIESHSINTLITYYDDEFDEMDDNGVFSKKNFIYIGIVIYFYRRFYR